MKKKILTLCLVVALAATAIIGGTMAYFTDTDFANNTMTLGKVDIVQNEKDADGNDFDATKVTLVPGQMVDKVITVTNEGDMPAYVRTILLFETGDVYAEGASTNPKDAYWEYLLVYGHGIKDLRDDEGNLVRVTVGDQVYSVGYVEYTDAVEAGTTTQASLTKFGFTKDAGSETYDLFGESYTILALSQAVQTDGFDDAATALNAGFGDLTADNIASWFE